MRSRVRSMLLFWILAIGFGVVVFRAIQIQVRPDPRLSRFAVTKEKLSQASQEEDFITSRGGILDRQNRDLAISIVTKSYFANPKVIKDPARVARRLAPILKTSAARLQETLKEDRFFVWLKREVDDEMARQIDALEIDGVYSRKESKRVYPMGEMARAVVGVSGRDGVGLEGLEKYYEDRLRASDEGKSLGFRDALGRLLLFSDFEKEWFDSPHLVTTLDSRLQRIVEDELAATVKEKKALSGQAIMMNPFTGEILAMASLEGARADKNELRNRAVTDLYEPGSTFKVMLAAAAMEHLGMTANSQIFGENGVLRVGNRTIKEYHQKKFQWLSLRELLEVSSNVASAKVGLKLGPEKFYETLTKFGFGKATGIDLPGEETGLVRKPSSWKPIELANIAFGQGIGVTPIQLVRAVSAVANGGYLVRPHLVSKIISSKENLSAPKVVWEAERQKEEIFKSERAKALTDMLIHVTETGSTGVAAAIEGYAIAGKTGTAQKLVEKTTPRGKVVKTYSLDHSVVSFVGYVPAYDPAFVLLVIYDDPEGRSSGGNTAAPSFRRIASRSLAILGVPPQRREEKAPDWVAAKPVVSSEKGRFIGRNFRDVLREVQGLSMDQRAKIDLVGYGTAVREELQKDDRLIVYFE